MTTLRLAIVTPGFPENEADSACIPALADYVLGLCRHAPDIDIRIFALAYPHFRGSYKWHGLPVFAAGRAGAGRLGRIAGYWELWRELRRVSAVQGKFDAVHSFFLGPAAALAQLYARTQGSRHVVTLMGQEARLSARYRHLLTSPHCRAAAIGDRQRDLVLERIPQARLELIPFGLDPLPIDALPEHERLFDIAFVGSLTPVKQPLLFLEVLARLDPAARAVMVGDGPLRGAIEARLRNLGLTERVTLVGHQPREKALQWLAQSRVLLHTSEFEGGPTVLDEALALGVAVAIRPVGKAANGPGCVVADGAKGLADAVRQLLDGPPPAPRLAHDVRHTVDCYSRLYAG